MTHHHAITQYFEIKIDAFAVGLATLFATVMLASIHLYQHLAAPTTAGGGGVQRSGLAESSTTTQAAAGGAWVTAEVIIALAAIALILVYQRLPEPIRNTIKWTLTGGLLVYLGAYTYGHSLASGIPYHQTYAAALTLIFAFVLLDELGLYWLLNNAFVLGLAVIVSAAAGFVVGVPVLVVGLIGLTAYDHYFANKQSWMFVLGGWFVNARFPVLFVWPERWRLDWDGLATAMLEYDHDTHDTDDSGGVLWGIGMADLALPAALAVTVTASTTTLPVAGVPLVAWGVLAGTILAVFRLRHTFQDGGGGAGLPALTTGSLAGYAIAVLATAIIAL